MSIPDEVIKKIEDEFEAEIKKIKGPSSGPPQKLEDIEKKVIEIRNKFGNRLMEEALKYQGNGELIEKKTARNVKANSKSKD